MEDRHQPTNHPNPGVQYCRPWKDIAQQSLGNLLGEWTGSPHISCRRVTSVLNRRTNGDEETGEATGVIFEMNFPPPSGRHCNDSVRDEV